MHLKEINYKEFKKDVYIRYIELFPQNERKGLWIIRSNMKKGIIKIFKIIEQDKFLGFMIINNIDDNKYVQLDYFAILPEYQSKGYGSKAILELKEKYKNKKAIFIEVEKEGYGKTEEENIIRKKRAKFYERLGFIKTKYDLEFLKVLYSTYVLPINNQEIDQEEMINSIILIYNKIAGKKIVNKYCKVIKNGED